MMEYEIFKGVVGEKFKEFLPEKYQDAQVEIRPVDKVNRTLDGLSIRVNEPGMNISPTIYVNHMYEDYVTTENLNATLERAAEGFMKAMEQKERFNVNELTNAECAKDKIVFQLINTEQNKEMLANMPHREFKDLSVIYRMVVKIDGEGIASTPIHHGLAETLGFTEEQLFKLAAENTKRLLPPVVKSMNDVMREIFMKDGMPPEIADMMLGEMPPEQQMYGKHLKSALEYITVPEKTQNGRLVSAINCQVDNAFEQMKETKKKFNKTDKRQAYHIILSFKEGEVSPDTVFELTERFVKEYLGNDYAHTVPCGAYAI